MRDPNQGEVRTPRQERQSLNQEKTDAGERPTTYRIPAPSRPGTRRVQKGRTQQRPAGLRVWADDDFDASVQKLQDRYGLTVGGQKVIMERAGGCFKTGQVRKSPHNRADVFVR
ncbi:hypothetical protein NDU88_006550 [Pleurodeles waltl]|uniref:Uncharacterized protein n=1 Tax=Pleurodeles waltl TaxID=8319 RepID=A0AAV7SPW1_PLEWA|nr:hypothetical protein NDU88_006550 [Pleurodeles waltl]